MKKNHKLKIVLIIMLLLLATGCTKTLTDSNKKAVRNESTGQNLIENILCKPTNKDTIKAYEENGVKLDILPKCEDFTIKRAKGIEYEGLWTSLFIRPLAFLLIFIGKNVGNYAISLIIISLIIMVLQLY